MNNRIFFGSQGVLLDVAGKNDLITNYFLSGVQSIGVNSSEEVSTARSVGKSQRFDDLYLEPSNEITLERLLSNEDNFWLELGSDFLYSEPRENLTYSNTYLLKPEIFGLGVNAWTTGSKTAVRAKNIPEYNLSLITTGESDTVLGASGLSQGVIYFPSCLVNSINYNIANEGFFTESVSLTNKIRDRLTSTNFQIDNTPVVNPTLLKRQHVYNNLSIYPYTVRQLTDFNKFFNGQEVFSINSISIDLSLSYAVQKNIGKWQQGDQTNWFTSLTLPVEVNCTFNITAKNAEVFDILNITDNFKESTDSNQTICIVVGVPYNGQYKFFIWNLGSRNRLISFNRTGGGTDGGLVEYEVSYRNTNNDFVTYTQEQASDSTLSPGLFSQSTESF